MAYRELTMTDVREVLRRRQSGHSIKLTARSTGLDRKTVRRYYDAAKELGVAMDAVLSDDVVHAVAQFVQARPLPTPSDAWSALVTQKERIATWLAATPSLKLSRIRTLLTREGVIVTYPTLRRFAMKELEWATPEATVRVDDPPAGQEAQVDFAEMGRVIDPETGKRRKLHVLIVTLSFSRHMFVWPTFRQTTDAVIEGLEAAWRFFGAMPRTLVPDNASSMIVGADATSPRLGETFAEYVHTRGIFVDPARVAHPRDKPRVERQVQHVRNGWFAGEKCATIAEWRTSATHWCRDIAGMRIHGTTRKVPRDVFEQVERAAMLPPPAEPFDVPTWTEAKVHPDHHIQVARALYSVPTAHLHKRVRVRIDSKWVRVYVATELIKIHPRKQAGERSTDPKDYPVGKAIYALRSVDALIAKAKERGEHVGRYAERILEGPMPWSQMRGAYKLLSLCDKYGDGRVESVCQSALGFDVIDVKRIERMLKLGLRRSSHGNDDGKVVQLPLPAPRFARGDDHFRTRTSTEEESR